MKIQVTPFHFDELLKKGYSLDQIFILKLIEEGVDVKDLVENTKIAALYQSLIRKALVFEKETKLTAVGQELLIFMASKEKKKLVKKAVESTEFDTWWEHYPATSEFTYNGKLFKGDRSMRVRKDDCRTKFNKIILEGNYTAEQLIAALDLEVLRKKETSFKVNENKLKYMHNSLSYLNQCDYEPFISLIKSGVKAEEKSFNYATDI